MKKYTFVSPSGKLFEIDDINKLFTYSKETLEKIYMMSLYKHITDRLYLSLENYGLIIRKPNENLENGPDIPLSLLQIEENNLLSSDEIDSIIFSTYAILSTMPIFIDMYNERNPNYYPYYKISEIMLYEIKTISKNINKKFKIFETVNYKNINLHYCFN
jgi:hypothetical protein